VETVGTVDEVLLEEDVKEVVETGAATLALVLTAASELEVLPPALTTAALEFVAATPTLVDEPILLTTVEAVASTLGEAVASTLGEAVASTLGETLPTDEAGDRGALAPTAMASVPEDTILKGLADAVKLTTVGPKRSGETCAAKAPRVDDAKGRPVILIKGGETGSNAINEPSAPVTSESM